MNNMVNNTLNDRELEFAERCYDCVDYINDGCLYCNIARLGQCDDADLDDELADDLFGDSN